jgi:hypothetical protein
MDGSYRYTIQQLLPVSQSDGLSQVGRIVEVGWTGVASGFEFCELQLFSSGASRFNGFGRCHK